MADRHTFEVELRGCRPEPLASYLKALGVLRLVGEQKDPDARAFWRGEHFVLESSLDRDALMRFLLQEWRPTPIVAPWNGGSGFYPKDNREASDAIVASGNARLAAFSLAIEIGRSLIASRGWNERPSDNEKVHAIATVRALLPDEALAWLDAAVVLGDDRLLFPPLLGTGGNDGRLDFSNNFQQRVVKVMAGDEVARVSLDSALFGTTATHQFKATMGQYHPAANERTNPWDFVLLIEGALLFAAAVTRRLEDASPTMMAFPFHARAAGGVATVTDSDEAESRAELWLPLWSAPATLRETRRLFAEGRATVGSGTAARPASSGLDFARAVTSLGVDRGIDAFCRVGFHVRNGLAYFATPLGLYPTRQIARARLLDEIDGWNEVFRRKAAGKNVPSRVAVAGRLLEQALFDAAGTGRLGPVLLALGDVERALSRSLSFSSNAFIRPMPRLDQAWADAVDDGSIEQRLAAALAVRPGVRGRLLPLDRTGRAFGRGDEPDFVFVDRPLVDNLHALLLREELEQSQELRGPSSELAQARCSLTDIARFIEGAVDDLLIERWVRALVLVEGGLAPELPADTIAPPASFCVLALVCGRRLRDSVLARTPGALSRACAGDAVGSTGAAIRRMNSIAAAFPVPAIAEPATRMRRVAAALAFPLSVKQRCALERAVLPPNDPIDDLSTSDSQQELA